MDSIKFFLGFAICFLGTIWLFNFHKLTQLEERYNKALQEHEKLLIQDSINQCIFDSLQYQLDSLHLRYQIFDSAPGRDFIDIMNAIIQVESRGNPKAYAPGEDAVGILQIRKCMVDDVNRILNRQKKELKFTYYDRWSRQKSIQMFEIYCEHYGLETAEEIARCWNGGPRGMDKEATSYYWEKVQDHLDS